jgi:tripartite-type tricarboxylate transporter receptor subunit TctC
MMKRVGTLLVVISGLIGSGVAAQPGYPEKPVRMIVNFSPGGPTDIVARILGQKLTDSLGKPFVIENIPGAGGNIGADRVAKAAPDGYTLLLSGSAAIVVNPSLYSKMPYDPVRDFAPVSQISTSPYLLVVHNGVSAKTVQELVLLAKAQPGQLTFASAGNGSGSHLTGELFKAMAGVDVRHVPYKGTGQTIPDLVGARVTMSFGPIAAFLPLVREGKLRALAVTSPKRWPTTPDVPTVAEAGFAGFESAFWAGLLAPAHTPATIIRKLHMETAKAVSSVELRVKFAELGMEPLGNSPEDFAAAIAADIPKWAKVSKNSGAKSH